MKYIIVFLLLAMLIAGCSQIESPLDSQDVKSAPGADVNGEDQPIVDCSEPAYFISVSPEPGSSIAPDTEITLTFSCAPEDFGFGNQRTLAQLEGPRNKEKFWGEDADYRDISSGNFRFRGIRWSISEYNRNIVRVSVVQIVDNLHCYERIGRTAYTEKWEPILYWKHGLIPISYNVVFPEIETEEPPPNVPYADIRNNPEDYLDQEVTFEAVVDKYTRHQWDEPGLLFIQSFAGAGWDNHIRDNRPNGVLRLLWDNGELIRDGKYRFTCRLSSFRVRGGGAPPEIEFRLIFSNCGMMLYPPIFVEE